MSAPGLNCGPQDLPSSLQPVGSLVASCGILFPDPGSNPGPLHWDLKVLATGPLGKSSKVQSWLSIFQKYNLKKQKLGVQGPHLCALEICSLGRHGFVDGAELETRSEKVRGLHFILIWVPCSGSPLLWKWHGSPSLSTGPYGIWASHPCDLSLVPLAHCLADSRHPGQTSPPHGHRAFASAACAALDQNQSLAASSDPLAFSLNTSSS